MNTTLPVYNRVPVVHETLADLDTPLSVYLKLAQGPYSYLLESAQGGEKWGRYSIIGLPARTLIKVHGHKIEVITHKEVVESVESDDPLTFIEAFQARFNVTETEGLPRFFGGLVGYFGYDTVRYVEKKLAKSTPKDTLKTPDIVLMVSEEVVVFDNLKGQMQMISLVDPDVPNSIDDMQNKLRARAESLSLPVTGVEHGTANQVIVESDFVSEFGEDALRQRLKKFAITQWTATSCRWFWLSV